MTAAVAELAGVVRVVETPDPPPAVPDLAALRALVVDAWPTLPADDRVRLRRALVELAHYARVARQALP